MADREPALVHFGRLPHHTSRALVCVPQAGCGAAVFALWQRALADTAAVWAVRLPGRETRLPEAAVTTMAQMVDDVVPEIAALEADDLVLFGHCSGALLAYEAAHALSSDSRRRRVRLIVSSQMAPGQAPPPSGRAISSLPMPELIRELRRIGGTADDILMSGDLMEAMAPMIRADFAAIESYRDQPDRELLKIPIIAIGGKNDSIVSRLELEHWARHTVGSFTLRLFDADHFYLDKEQSAVLAFVRTLFDDKT
ncbi:MAG TPA: alpha/beta fold hydrolase [Streptosporangiaceae bacterium]|nr:alpha/beta fold hydrolase [Streptosporangiaceae bacterium]